MDKKKLFLDFDNTIVNSTKAYCDVYNFVYKDCKEFKKAEWYKVEKYDLTDQCPLATTRHIFSDEMFFDVLELMDKYTYDILRELSKKYQIIICSIGTFTNISYKTKWIKDKLPMVKDAVMITNSNCQMDKSIVDMSGSIFIDDVESNLISANAEYKLIFGDEYEWNHPSKYSRVANWKDIKRLLL